MILMMMLIIPIDLSFPFLYDIPHYLLLNCDSVIFPTISLFFLVRYSRRYFPTIFDLALDLSHYLPFDLPLDLLIDLSHDLPCYLLLFPVLSFDIENATVTERGPTA